MDGGQNMCIGGRSATLQARGAAGKALPIEDSRTAIFYFFRH
jgi:hypothetical protein